MIIFRQGSLLDAEEKIIVQQVNCMGVMGRGLAKDIRAKYPRVYKEYTKLCEEKKPSELLGTCQMIQVSTNKTIANIFGQMYYGVNSRFTNYNALVRGFTRLLLKANCDIAIPYGIGCALGREDWEKLISILQILSLDFKNNIIVYNNR